MTRPSFNTNKPFAIVPDILLINIKFVLRGIRLVVWCGSYYLEGGGRSKVRAVINARGRWMGRKRLRCRWHGARSTPRRYNSAGGWIGYMVMVQGI